MKKTIESKAAGTILQTERTERIGDQDYRVAPPTLGTLIMASEAVAQLPDIDINTKPEGMLIESLRTARHCHILGDIVAILALGAKHIDATRTVEKRRLFGLIRTRSKVSLRKEIAQQAENMEPKELAKLIARLLEGMQVAFFFGITTSLAEANILKPTKTTASGQS